MAKQLDLLSTGGVVIRLEDGREWKLRTPTLREYREAFQIFEAADNELQAALTDVPADDIAGRVKIANGLQLGLNDKAPLYGTVLCEFIRLLSGDQPPAAEDLPAWAVSSDVSAQLLRHFRAVPLDPGDPA